MEVWKDIPGYEGKYQISNLGRVKSLKDRWGNEISVIRKPSKNNHGYIILNLSKSNKLKNFKVHRLVAEAFILNPNNYPLVNHKDENKVNNNVNNLEWCTAKYNNTYGTKTKIVADKNSKKVYQYDLQGNLIKEWPNTVEATKNGFTGSCISRCCNSKRNNHKGFIWSYTKLD